ncbi:MAG: HAD family phosphatase [Dehalococcoidales bacterium]|nr:HAD family phosphatase [Dehalococcoidales bacterium]
MYKLLVTDLDGTLFNKEGKIGQPDIDAIRDLIGRGVNFAFASGRITMACRDIISLLGINCPGVYCDGALVYDSAKDEVIYQNLLDKELLREFITFSHENDIYLEMFSKTHFYAERPNWSDPIHTEFFSSFPTMVKLEDVIETDGILKSELLSHSPEEEALVERFRSRFEDKCRFSLATSPSFPNVRFYNILSNGTSKGNAVRALADHLGVSIDEVVAVGDGYNDISMLKEVGMPVAMGNAYDAVKEVAKYVTKDVKDCGVADVIRKFF